MNGPLRPLSPYPSAAFRSIGQLVLHLAALEQQASEARTKNLRHRDTAAHPATTRLLDELEFLHASHARALLEHASFFEETVSKRAALEQPSTPEVPGPQTGDFDEILISTYERLNLLAALYTRLHTLAVAFEHRSSAELSLNHLKAITPRIMTCSQAIPLVTADEALRHFGSISHGCADTALEATQAAWKNDTQFPATT